jgi:hypothetical protein
MILYKYISPEGALKVLEENSIAFSIASEFNDPFETQVAYPFQASNPIEGLFEGIRSWGKRYIWTENSGVLSLTRNPTNSLMWSHYASEHRGLVIGFNADTAGFCDESKCLIPAQYGSIIYAKTRPISGALSKPKGEPISVGHTHHYPAGHHEKLSLLFLQKAMCWSYEEEVREVKCIADRDSEGANDSGQFHLVETDGRRLYCYELPVGSSKEIYLGLRHSALASQEDFYHFFQQVSNHHAKVEIKACRLSKDTWDFEIVDPYKCAANRANPAGTRSSRA